MSGKLSVSIGISAYNEENNILQLISALKNQDQKRIRIDEILIYSDGSTDRTPQILKSLKDPKIKLEIGTSRIGQQMRQNQLLQNYQGDVSVIFEGDILPYNKETIENLVAPFITDKSGKLGMVVGKPEIVKPINFLETVLFYGYQMKYKMFADWKGGDNLYSCGGHSMKALSRVFTSQLRWPEDVPEDAYIYLRLKELGLKLHREDNARAYMKNVANFKDRFKQVKKFLGGKKALARHFPKDFLRSEYNLPKSLLAKHLILAFLKNPLWITLYLGEVALNRIFTLGNNKFNALYSPYLSSKKLV